MQRLSCKCVAPLAIFSHSIASQSTFVCVVAAVSMRANFSPKEAVTAFQEGDIKPDKTFFFAFCFLLCVRKMRMSRVKVG